MSIQTIEIARIDTSGRLRPINPTWSAAMTMHIANPALVGTFAVGDTFYVDFIPVE